MLHHVATDGVQETRADALRAHTDGRADAAQRACAERTDAVERTLREVLQPALYYSTVAALAAPWAAGRGRAMRVQVRAQLEAVSSSAVKPDGVALGRPTVILARC